MEKQRDFSLVLGEPLCQLWQRERLAGGTLQLLQWRVLVLALLTVVPLEELIERLFQTVF